MKTRIALTAAALALAAVTAQAHDRHVYTIPSGTVTQDSAIHSGAANVDDQALADRIAQAFAADRAGEAGRIQRDGFREERSR